MVLNFGFAVLSNFMLELNLGMMRKNFLRFGYE